MSFLLTLLYIRRTSEQYYRKFTVKHKTPRPLALTGIRLVVSIHFGGKRGERWRAKGPPPSEARRQKERYGKGAPSGCSRKNIWGPGPSSFGRQQRLSEITIEPIRIFFWGGELGKIWGRLCLLTPT